MRRIGVWCLLCMLWTSAAILAQETITLTNPIAYIGRDRNVYLTDGTTTVALTSDAAMDDYGQGTTYYQPRWSPDGNRLAFIRNVTPYGETMMLAESGEPPEELIGAADGVYFGNHVLAWSPDGTEIAFVGTANAPFGLFAVSVEDRHTRDVAQTLAPSIGEGGGGEDPASALGPIESGQSAYRECYYVRWSDEGIVYGPAACFCTALITPQGSVLEEWPLGSMILPSADGLYIVIVDGTSYEPIALVDVAHQAEVPLEIYPVAWMDGSLLYTTRTVVATAQGDPAAPSGAEVFEDYWGSFVAEKAALSVWRYEPGGEDTLVFETEGNDFGVVRPTADNRLLVSITTSNLDAVTALNNGAAPEDVWELLAHPVTYLIDGDEVILTIDGGQPDASSATFTVVPPA